MSTVKRVTKRGGNLVIITMILVVEGAISWRRRTLVEGRGGFPFADDDRAKRKVD